ncbi:MAG TPA: 1-acyl-sn-glycerol-3-phosphate acyltransferase [Bacteroidales bacterium]|nr:1-acyl-sn-glycerol-3-phosphate acyltransferase [Bacteroidales bacterium]
MENISQQQEGLINVERVIASKSRRLKKLLPGFIIRYLRRVIHEEDVNGLLLRYKELTGLDFIDAILKEFGAVVTAVGQENIPKEGRIIISSNHPLGGLDGLALMQVVGKVRKDLLFPVNDLLMHIPNLKPLFIPVNKHGRNTENLQIFDNAFAGGSAILYFPAGFCSRKVNGKITDLEWKKTFVAKARQHSRDIVPAYIDGRNTNFFYNLANLRVKLGIKTNIEMIFLVNEMFKQRDKQIRIRFGKPISFTTFDRSKKDNAWADFLKKETYSLAAEVSEKDS